MFSVYKPLGGGEVRQVSYCEKTCTLPTWSYQQRTSELFVWGRAAADSLRTSPLCASASDIHHQLVENQFALSYFSYSFYTIIPQ